MVDASSTYYQTANRRFVEEDLGKSQWVQISGHQELNGADAGFWCALLNMSKKDVVFRSHSWDVTTELSGPGFVRYGKRTEYRSNLLEDDGFEPLLHYREFYGVKKSFVELDQEFVLLNNLYFDEQKKTHFAMLDDGTADEVVRVKNEDCIFIKLSYLLRYAAAKQMAIVLYYDIRTKFDVEVAALGVNTFSEEHKNEDVFYQVWGGDLDMLEKHAFSVLMGKKIIGPRPIETCGYWPFEKKKEFIDFIYGTDENGNEKTYTCDPDRLSNFFGKNPNCPHYLTPVFFKRDVLQKYTSQPELYSVRDGYLECKSLWRVEIDNHHKDFVSVYLGDLGRDLPESERLYWKSYNVASDVGLSTTSFKRDFLGISAESNMIEHRFKAQYIQTNKNWIQSFGWSLFLPLAEEDQYNFDLLRIPFTDSQEEFDRLVLSLVKVIIDSLNEKSIQKNIENEPSLKGIGKLEKWLNSTGCIDYEEHVRFLRELQELRSQGTGHRKGSGYDKIASVFGVGEKGLKDVFESILLKAEDFLLYMSNIANQNKMVLESQ